MVLARQQVNPLFSGAAAVRGAMMVTSSTYVTYALGLVTSIVVARMLGPVDFGRYSYAVWLAGLLIMIGNNGLTTTAIRFVSESLGRRLPASASGVHGWMLRRQYACMALVAVAFLALLPLFDHGGWEGTGVWMLAAVSLTAALAKMLFLLDVSVGKGYGRYGVEAMSTVTMSVVSIIAVLVLAGFKAGLEAYLVLFAVVSVGHLLSSRLMLRRAAILPTHNSIEPDVLHRLRRHLFWTVILALTYALSNKSIETYLLNRLVGPAAVGYFAIAAALTRGGIEMLSSGLTTVLMPMMAHAFGEGGPERSNAIMATAVRYFSFMGFLLAGIGVPIAAPAIHLLYGNAYAEVVLPLQVMILVGGLTLTEGAFNALLSTTDNQRFRVAFVGLSLAVTATLAFALIPRYGLMGAVVAHAASRIIVLVGIAIGTGRMMQLRMPWRALGGLAAAAAMAAVPAIGLLVFFPGLWAGLAAAVIYAACFMAGTLAFGAWQASDAMQLASFLKRYPRLHAAAEPTLQRWADGLR